MKTRLLNHPTLNYNVTHPILLHADSYFTTLVMNYYHEENYRNGVNSTLNLVRQNFWIRTGRQRFKKVLKKCFICNYIQKHPLNPTEVAALPSFRVSCEHAFENVGVDFVGPLYYKVSNNEMKKCYILLFTCAVSRATHLELTTDVGTDSVILALWRFIRRRGKPNHIIRDNFKSFKASTLKRFLAHQGIKWSFILERSPWWGDSTRG